MICKVSVGPRKITKIDNSTTHVMQPVNHFVYLSAFYKDLYFNSQSVVLPE
jgi:hypothetical protein